MKRMINKNECKQFAGKYFATLKVSVLAIFDEKEVEYLFWFGDIPEKKIKKYMSRYTTKKENKGKYYYCFDFNHRATICKHCFDEAGDLLPLMEEKLYEQIRNEAKEIFFREVVGEAC